MSLNESVSAFLDQGFQELGKAQMSFGMKLLVMFGAFYLLQMLAHTGFSLINLCVYIIGFFKWLIFKIMRRNI